MTKTTPIATPEGLELRNISYNRALSEETNCYSAKLYLKGVHIADVCNRGCGGPDDLRTTKGHDEKELEPIDAFFKALPEIPSQFTMGDGKTLMLKPDLELWCGERVDEFILTKQYRSIVKRKVLMIEDGKVHEFSWKGLKALTPQHIEHVAKKYPQAKILNTLPEAEALALFRAHG